MLVPCIALLGRTILWMSLVDTGPFAHLRTPLSDTWAFKEHSKFTYLDVAFDQGSHFIASL